jgi:hypothetical protein
MTQNERNIARFPLTLLKRFEQAKWDSRYDFLYYHQNIPRIYFDDETTRGLMIYHGTGMGKSRLATSLAMDNLFPPDDMINIIRKRQIIVLLAKTLADNMRSAIREYIQARKDAAGDRGCLGAFGALCAMTEEARDAWIERNFGFVTLNASNMFDQVSRTSVSVVNDENDLLFDVKAASLMDINLDGKIVIIDEAHNFFRAITNGSRNSANLYHTIMKARNIKLVFLTGTPIANHPFELTMCFNMLAGDTILPIQFDEFDSMFIDHATHSIKNRGKFQNRIFGLLTFVDFNSTPGISVQKERPKQHVEFPLEYPMEIVHVPMQPDQFEAYIIARERERDEGIHKAGSAKLKVVVPMRRFSSRETPSLQKPHSSFSSSYRVHSRQISNYCPPEHMRIKMQNGGSEISHDIAYARQVIDEIGTITSVKFSAILDRINYHEKQLGLIYSQFVGVGGLLALARFLDQNGYSGKYAIITGEIKPEDRTNIIDAFCASENMHGANCQLLLISSTGAEGINLKNVRHVHIMEPYWNYGRIKQVKARAIRNQSHIDLPPNEQNVITYIYIAVAPKGSISQEITSDEELYNNARETQLLVDSFENALKEISIECSLNHSSKDRTTNCRICAPTDVPLFTDDIASDIATPDPCKPALVKSVSARPITVGDETFYYKDATPGSIEEEIYQYELFIKDLRIQAYRKLPLNDARYPAIIAAIKNAVAKK